MFFVVTFLLKNDESNHLKLANLNTIESCLTATSIVLSILLGAENGPYPVL